MMTYDQFTKAENVTDAEVQRRTGLSRFHLSRVRHQSRPLTRAAAVRIWAGFKVKLEPVAHLSDADLKTLARLEQAP